MYQTLICFFRTVPKAFIEENAAPAAVYPPQGKGMMKKGQRIRDGLPTPPQQLR